MIVREKKIRVIKRGKEKEKEIKKGKNKTAIKITFYNRLLTMI